MSQGEQSIPVASEVELSTDDLVQLSERDAPKVVSKAYAIPVAPDQRTTREAKKAAVVKRTRRSRAAMYAIGAVAVVASTAAVIFVTQPKGSSNAVRHALRWTPLPTQDPEPLEETLQPAATSKPVRIRNEFDRSEVFEFPPGTSKQEARDAVARILLERAMERQTTAASTKK